MNPTDLDIIARAQAGEEEAFRMLVERHGRSVFRLAYRLTGRPDDAEDVVQETFLKVFRSIDTFEERARFDTWLYRVTSNSAMDLIRRRQRHDSRAAPLDQAGAGLPLEAAIPGPDHLAGSRQLGGRIAAAMEQLTPGERAAFCLRHVDGLSIAEIGETLGLRASAVKNAIFRAVQKMRQQLAPVSETS